MSDNSVWQFISKHVREVAEKRVQELIEGIWFSISIPVFYHGDLIPESAYLH